MKRFSDHVREREEARKALIMEHLDKERKWLREIVDRNFPLYEEKGIEKRQVETDRNLMRSLIDEGEATRIGLACDHCGTELINRSPGSEFASFPPKKAIGCPGCGWKGFLRAIDEYY